ncbi:AAA family ATPase [Halostagnicola sp. A-GB9-2]|uniref:AAA family ATPase n=1 Tax=Halostagnicola sp. A-GB9-2 TaxID=3048066 RepID=UPI0024BF1D74|nr:AAA family ATPase [Halostagnicola sp. A-GB9-2]MDJ1431144.1 AAA family ATPase [Halostagnicola sp. A-GB9-2]
MSEQKRLVVVCGLPGTGKTTVARDLTERTGGTLMRTDVVRKDLFPEPEYTDEEVQATYDELFDRTRSALEQDGIAVLDGTFRRESLRDRARRVARKTDATFDLVRVTCSEKVVRERINERENDESDADFSVHKLLQSEFEPPTIAHQTVDNSGSVAETRQQIAELW